MLRNINRQAGYTLKDLLYIFFFFLTLGMMTGSVIVVIHFICKYW